MNNIEFDAIRDKIRKLNSAKRAGNRLIQFIDPQQVVAVSRNKKGGLEIFICGDSLTPTDPSLKPHLQHGFWKSKHGQEFQANRVSFPTEPYFESVVALICVELLQKISEVGVIQAFGELEPLIALGFDERSPSVQVAVGLAGELYLLHTLVTQADLAPEDVVEAWHGYRRSTRDFSLGGLGIEIKTTTKQSSRHSISSLAQIELGNGVDATPEVALHLLSLGLLWLPPGTQNSLTVQSMVEDICAHLTDAQRKKFLHEVLSYGGDPVNGYRHGSKDVNEIYKREFRITFTRLYDLSDPAIEFLTSAQLAGLRHVVSDSVRYRIELPNQIRGEVNPISDMETIIDHIYSQTLIIPVGALNDEAG